jgi:hypothetical protein
VQEKREQVAVFEVGLCSWSASLESRKHDIAHSKVELDHHTRALEAKEARALEKEVEEVL